MAGPTTEAVNEDVKAIREDLHKVEVALREEIHQVVSSLSEKIHKVDNGLTELRTEVRNAIGIGKWVASIVVGLLLTGGVSAVWWASSINTRMDGVEKRFDKLESMLAKIAEQTKAK